MANKKKKFNKQRLWIKTVANEKITRNTLYEINGTFNKTRLRDYLVDVCHEWDIPTPMVLKMHEQRLDSFNVTRFSKNDFVESIDFDTLSVEYSIEE